MKVFPARLNHNVHSVALRPLQQTHAINGLTCRSPLFEISGFLMFPPVVPTISPGSYLDPVYLLRFSFSDFFTLAFSGTVTEVEIGSFIVM